MKFLKFFVLLNLFVLFASCASNLPDDPYPNPAQSNYHRMEFDVYKGAEAKKEIGISNLYLYENQSLDNIYFTIDLLYTGTLTVKSDSCGIDISTSFNGAKTFYLKDLITKPMKCSIRFLAETDKIGKKQTIIVESGVLKLNTIPEKSSPVGLEYTRTNTTGGLKVYTFTGQGSLQRQEGSLTYNEVFTVKTPIAGGGSYRITGCGETKNLSGKYTNSILNVRIKDLYKNDYLTKDETCDFEILMIPDQSMYSNYGRFSLSIYGSDVVKLEPLNYNIDNNLTTWGNSYVLGCMINNTYNLGSVCKVSYSPGTLYWVKSYTLTGRKNVFGIYNGQVFWTE